MEIRELILLLLRRKIYLIVVPVVTAIMMFLVRFNSPREYESESQLSTGLTYTKGIFGESVAVSPYSIALNFSNLIENMRSKRVVNGMSYRLLLHDLSEVQPFKSPKFGDKEANLDSLRKQLSVRDALESAILEFKTIEASSSMGKQIYKLLEKYGYTEFDLLSGSNIYRKGSSDWINIRYSCEDPRLAAFVVNTWAKSFIDYYNYTNATRLSGGLAALRQIMDQKENRLNQSLDKLNKFRSSNVIVNSQTESVNQQLNDYKRQISDEESNARRVQLTLENLREQIGEVDNGTSTVNRDIIVSLRNQIDQLSNELFENPGDEQLTIRLNTARNDLQSAMYKYNSSSSSKLDELFEQENRLEVELRVSLERLDRLRTSYSRERQNIRSITSKSSTLEILDAEVTSNREEYLKAEKDYSDALSSSTIGTSSIQISYTGEIPEKPKSRKTILFSILGFGFGLVITLFLVVSLEFIDNRIKSPAKFKRVIGKDPIAVIRNFKNCRAQFAGIIQGQFDGLSENEAEFFLNNLRKIRFEFQSLNNKVFLFTSLRKGSGKSFLLSSIAYSLSMIDKRVLIIDTNFRHNSISRSYSRYVDENNIDRSSLHDLLTENIGQQKLKEKNEANSEEINPGLITKTVNTNIDLIISQNINMTPSEIFSKVRFGSFIEELLKGYDYVFFEGAELNIYSDSKELSKYSDFIVPIFSIEDKIESVDKVSLKFLEGSSIGVKMILNNVMVEDIE